MMKNFRWNFPALSVLIVLCAYLLIGCSGSEKASKEKTSSPPPQANAAEMKQINDLKTENASLKEQLGKLQQDNRTATARAADLETQLADLKEQVASKSQPPPKPVAAIKPKPIAKKEPAPTEVVGTKPKPKSSAAVSDKKQPYEKGVDLFQEAKYAEAASVFQSILDGNPAATMVDNCHYWLGECEFGQKKYREAIAQFEKVLTFSQSEKGDDAQIMIANSYAAMGDKVKAKEEYKKLIDNFPSSPFVRTAKVKMSQL